MSQVEDVASPPRRPLEHIVGRAEHALERCQQDRRVQISLNCPVGADALPGLVKRRPPVGADDVAACRAQFGEDSAGADAEMNRRHAERLDRVEQPACVRQDEFAIVGGIQRADPRVEYLHRVDAGLDLRDQVVGNHLGQAVAEAVPRRGCAVHQCLRMRKIARVSSLDRVGCQRERRPGKPDQRRARPQLLLDLADCLEHVCELLTRLEPPDAGEVRFRAKRLLDGRAFAGHEVERDAHRRERQEQVGKENRRVDVNAEDRLQRDLGGQVGRAAQIEQRIPLAQCAIFAHIPAGLAHEPDGRGIDRL